MKLKNSATCAGISVLATNVIQGCRSSHYLVSVDGLVSTQTGSSPSPDHRRKLGNIYSNQGGHKHAFTRSDRMPLTRGLLERFRFDLLVDPGPIGSGTALWLLAMAPPCRVATPCPGDNPSRPRLIPIPRLNMPRDRVFFRLPALCSSSMAPPWIPSTPCQSKKSIDLIWHVMPWDWYKPVKTKTL
jgi:hypothetical protein